MAKGRPAAALIKIWLFLTAGVSMSQNKTSRVRKDGFRFLNFSSQMQYCSKRTTDRIAKLGSFEFGRISPILAQRRRYRLVLEEIILEGGFQILELRRGRDQLVFMAEERPY